MDRRADSVQVKYRLVPWRTRVAGEAGARLKIQLAAPPVDGEAKLALVEFLADALGVRKSEVALVRGEKGRRKTVRVAGQSAGAAEAAFRRLAPR